MNYSESVQYVENASYFGSKKDDLNNIIELLRRLGNPQREIKAIHVAGTNGKGSVCAFLESVLRTDGYKTGLFTSPYIVSFNERIKIAGLNIRDELFADITSKVRQCADEMKDEGYLYPTFFELVTAIAFEAFKKEKVDIAIIETGIGGTYDSTNVIEPILSVIMSIGFDHTKVLGNTIDKIAENKAGIIKQNTPVVIYPQVYDEAYAVFLSKAKEVCAPLYAVKDASIKVNAMGLDGGKFELEYSGINAQLETSLLGQHQITNASTAFIALCVLAQQTKFNLKSKSIIEGIKKTVWQGRLQIISRKPLIIVDGAHNKQGSSSLVEAIKSFYPIGKVNIILGVLESKDVTSMAKELSKISKMIYTVAPEAKKAVNSEELTEILTELEIKSKHVGNLFDTIKYLNNSEQNIPIIICGSLYLVGDVLRKAQIIDNISTNT